MSASATDQASSATQVPQDTCAIIAAGGIGQRFGDPRGKQYVDVAGLPVIDWAIAAFAQAPSIGHIVVVCPVGRIAETRAAAEQITISVPVSYVEGGATRQDSCRAGIQAVPEAFTYVAIHDGARPLITAEAIENIVAALRANPELDGAIYAHPSTDTLKVVEEGIVQSTPERKRYWTVQTPQIFPREVVLAAHEAALAEGFVGTDDSSLVERSGGKILCVDSPSDNIKVTVPEDKVSVEAILARRAWFSGAAGDETC